MAGSNSLRPWRRKGNTPWSPWDEFDRFREQMWEFMNSPFQRMASSQGPSVDVYETGDSVVVKADLPGVDPKDVDLQVYDDHVVLRAQIRQETEVEEDNFYRRERYQGSLHREIPLDVPVEPEKAEATFKNGVLELRIPKAASASKGHRVNIRNEE
ncbi:MAG: Hsp20/alpha crystallin family protein [Firmicutes bacterium]|nr:Hsp20/alpha crystallin family protein [Bacillota bacterium]